MLRLLRIIAEITAAIIGITVVLALLLIWRLSSRPVTSDFMTPYIESGIESILPGSQVKVAKTLLVWDNVDQSITMHADGIEVRDMQGDDIAVIPSLHARINAFGLLFGQFMPRALTIDHPQFKLDRESNGTFVFGGLSMKAGNGAEPSKTSTFDALKAGLTRLTSTVFMRRLQVDNAVFEIRDVGTQKMWAIGIPEISIKRTGLREIGNRIEFGALEGKIAVEVTQKDGVATLDLAYLYDPLTHEHSLSTNFADFTPAYLAGGHPETLGIGLAAALDLPISGRVSVTLDKDLVFKTATANIHGDKGRLVYPDFWDAPCPINSVDINGQFDRDQNKLTIKDTRIDFNGPVLELDVGSVKSATSGKDADFNVVVRVDKLPTNRYAEIWPKPVLPNPREWLVANLRNGMFNHAEVKLKGAIAWADPANFSLDEGGGKISLANVRVNYLEGMPPAEGVSGDATFDLNKMEVSIAAGGLGNIRMKPFTVTISGLSDYDQFIDIPLQVAGPLPEILRLIDYPPLGYAKALGIAPEDIQGRAEGSVSFNFPLLKTLLMKDVQIKAVATASGVATSKLVPGLDIDQGEFTTTLDTAGMALKGRAAINKVPLQIVWQENFNSASAKILRHAVVSGPVRDDQWPLLGITFFEGSKGVTNLVFEMTKPDKKRLLYSGSLDMGAAIMNVGVMGWKKPANSPAVLKFSASSRIGENVDVGAIEMRGDKLRINGTAQLSSDISQLLKLNLTTFVVGRSNATIKLAQSFGDNGSFKLDVVGIAFDTTNIDSGKSDKPDLRKHEYRLQLDRLYTSENGFIDKAHGYAISDAQGWSDINIHGIADGKSPLDIELTPQPNGTRSLTIASEDFGGAMRGLGFTDTIRGGKLSIKGQSTIEAPRQIDGQIKISAFTVEHLPVLALLINATSPFGFAGILTDSADFSRLEGNYRWVGDSISLNKMHAAGSAMGINCDGKIDLNSNEAALRGTLVPFSVVNKFINYIPLIGDLITGGEDQGVLAVNYEIKGPLSDLHVSVNPISLLTPGFIRNLFFRDNGNED